MDAKITIALMQSHREHVKTCLKNTQKHVYGTLQSKLYVSNHVLEKLTMPCSWDFAVQDVYV